MLRLAQKTLEVVCVSLNVHEQVFTVSVPSVVHSIFRLTADTGCSDCSVCVCVCCVCFYGSTSLVTSHWSLVSNYP